MSSVLWPWLAEAGLITVRSVKQSQWPLPSQFLATFVVFGVLGVLAESPKVSTPAAVFGWGLVIATFMNVVDPTDPAHPFGTLKAPPGSAQPNNAAIGQPSGAQAL